MKVGGYRDFLMERNINTDTIEAAIATIEAFETFLRTFNNSETLRSVAGRSVNAFSEQLIARESNSRASYLALMRYGLFVGNRALYAAALGLLDGAEALENLYARIGCALGEGKRDAIFEDVPLPPLGTPNERKPALVQRVLDRLEAIDGPETCRRILGRGLRNLKDEWFQDAVTEYKACSSLDEYLIRKSERFIAVLEKHKQDQTWWFAQEITDQVIDLVRQHPMMSAGVREGRVLYQVKIPYMSKEWLEESDPNMKRYYACHCPWVRESLRLGSITVSPTFCNCSAAFHKKPWEIIFGQSLQAEIVESVLNGASQCKIAIHLPEGTI